MKFITDIIDLFYPRLCRICGRTLMSHEKELCLHCVRNIPRTDFHKKESHPMEQLFRGKADIQEAYAFFYFTRDGEYRKLIHRIKYNGEKRCGEFLGSLFAQELLQARKLQNIDIIAPVPLHAMRKRSRGYNQSEWIARGIAETLHKEMHPHLLCRKRKSESQTHKSLYERWTNTQSAFLLKDTDNIEGKHILLVDDVVTSGATLLACARELEKIKGCKISLLTLAIAQ